MGSKKMRKAQCKMEKGWFAGIFTGARRAPKGSVSVAKYIKMSQNVENKMTDYPETLPKEISN